MKYRVHPGYVNSQRDGDEHFITAGQLIRLYGVDPADCCVVTTELGRSREHEKNVIHLYPRYDGNYNLKDRNAA